MTLRKRIIIIAGVALGIIIAALLFFIVNRNEPRDTAPAAPVGKESQTIPAGASAEAPVGGAASVAPAEDLGERYVRQLAGIFVERFGSYSNQDDNRHLDDAVALSTARMAAWIKTQAISAGQNYQGKTTRVVASKVESYASTAAKVSVDVQEEVTGSSGGTTVYRSGKVELAKVEGEWKVSGLFWN